MSFTITCSAWALLWLIYYPCVAAVGGRVIGRIERRYEVIQKGLTALGALAMGIFTGFAGGWMACHWCGASSIFYATNTVLCIATALYGYKKADPARNTRK